jgi:hypothetical protein
MTSGRDSAIICESAAVRIDRPQSGSLSPPQFSQDAHKQRQASGATIHSNRAFNVGATVILRRVADCCQAAVATSQDKVSQFAYFASCASVSHAETTDSEG